MFRCERCGSSYSSAHAVGIENCPRCLLRDRAVAPLSFKVFDLPRAKGRPASPSTEGLAESSAATPPS
jgi:predicted  nucleic acid-binding Zn-ribbon protein